MKKLFLLIFILIAVKAFAQYPRPTGVTAAVSMQGLYKVVGPDTLYWIRTGTGLYIPVGRAADFAAFDRNFKVVGDSVHIADSVYKNNFVFNSAAVSLPALTLISANNDPLNPSDFTIKNYLGQTIFEVGYTGGVFAGSVSNINTGLNSRIDLTTTGTVIERRFTGGAILSLATGTGDFFKFDSLGMYMYHPTDTTTLTKGLVIDPVSGRVYTQTLTAGGGGTTTHPLTMNNTGGGAASGSTFDGSVAQTVSYNTVGALSDGSTVAGHSFISDNVTLSSLSATNPSITFTGSYTGQVNRTLGINWGFSNPWTIVQQFQGGISYNSRSASSTDAIANTDYYLNYTGTFTATLPHSSLIVPNQTFVITSNTGTITLAAFSGETISGGASITITAGQTATVYYAGGLNWVAAQIATVSGASVVTSFNTRAGVVVPVAGDYASLTETLTNKTISGASNTLTNIDNSSLVNSTVSGVALGNSLFAHTPGFGLSGSNYDGHNAQTWTVDTATAVKGKTGYNTDYSNLSTRINSKVPATRTLTINGVAFDLSADRSWTVGSSVTPVSGEIPTGTINGTNPTFTIAHTPISGSVSVYINGIMERPTTDWTVSGTTVTMIDIPVTGDNLMISYQY